MLGLGAGGFGGWGDRRLLRRQARSAQAEGIAGRRRQPAGSAAAGPAGGAPVERRRRDALLAGRRRPLRTPRTASGGGHGRGGHGAALTADGAHAPTSAPAHRLQSMCDRESWCVTGRGAARLRITGQAELPLTHPLSAHAPVVGSRYRSTGCGGRPGVCRRSSSASAGSACRAVMIVARSTPRSPGQQRCAADQSRSIRDGHQRCSRGADVRLGTIYLLPDRCPAPNRRSRSGSRAGAVAHRMWRRHTDCSRCVSAEVGVRAAVIGLAIGSLAAGAVARRLAGRSDAAGHVASGA